MYQQVTIAGYLGQDPEMRELRSGQHVTNFNVAANRRWTDRDGQQQEETVWVRVSTWGRQAEVCQQYLSKGDAVLVVGRLRPDEQGNPRVWEGSDGVARASYEVTAQTVRFLSRNGRSEPQYSGPSVAEEEEEILF